MKKFTVHKTMTLVFECDAEDAEEAVSHCINADDVEDMWVAECDYEVFEDE